MPIRPDLRHFYAGEQWQAIRAETRDRAGDKCEHCGRPNHIWGIQCGCAHLNHDPSDNRDENLAWLCRACHLIHDRLHHKETRSIRKDAARPLLQEAVCS
jgi:5-methylcytosine-specific restriction endonuclease McrA